MKTTKLSEVIKKKMKNIKQEKNNKLFIMCMQVIKDVEEKKQENVLNQFLVKYQEHPERYGD